MSKSLPTLLLLLAPLWVAAAPADKAYRTAGDCDGFPAVALTTAEGLCVGVVAEGLGKARGVAVIADDVFVVDMAAWDSRHGRLLKLSHGGRDAPEVVLHDLNQPNAVVRGSSVTRGEAASSASVAASQTDASAPSTRALVSASSEPPNSA